ncbi:hypothetical protein HanRHA438_Chr12g0566751 [Helianthus annuus]|uniref:Secreted protein n=1 Tax=Helianthus annuus TaxID=4232 RepID=A0A9K3HIU0_HELAN|nr:hypothetical protein HanXRQr2_Chr12g0555341 [Helianthus annuus]KAJ0494609.1 hypothetical protein HanIR_Chr12g0599411 [Helianthus annuus]KAJ0863837.1 hypothetical protein HanPSC8_Chr12g0534691 [Helianthus annuus]KAJ0867747.1 hypothetical protein HanRHA438_Chr12g0566751 [Helianthus annuus]
MADPMSSSLTLLLFVSLSTLSASSPCDSSDSADASNEEEEEEGEAELVAAEGRREAAVEEKRSCWGSVSSERRRSMPRRCWVTYWKED